MAPAFAQNGRIGKSAGSHCRGQGACIQAGAKNSGKISSDGAESKRKERDMTAIRLLCVFCLQDGVLKSSEDYNSLRKHQGRTHNVWCNADRTYCPKCKFGLENKTKHEALPNCVAIMAERRRHWKPQPAANDAQRRADCFAVAGPVRMQEALRIVAGKVKWLEHRPWKTQQEVQERLAIVLAGWAEADAERAARAAALAQGAGNVALPVATQPQYPQTVRNNGTALPLLAPAPPAVAMAGVRAWTGMAPQQQCPQQTMGYTQPAPSVPPPISGFWGMGMPQQQYPQQTTGYMQPAPPMAPPTPVFWGMGISQQQPPSWPQGQMQPSALLPFGPAAPFVGAGMQRPFPAALPPAPSGMGSRAVRASAPLPASPLCDPTAVDMRRTQTLPTQTAHAGAVGTASWPLSPLLPRVGRVSPADGPIDSALDWELDGLIDWERVGEPIGDNEPAPAAAAPVVEQGGEDLGIPAANAEAGIEQQTAADVDMFAYPPVEKDDLEDWDAGFRDLL